MVVDEEKKTFSSFYWTCKLYEHPYKARFIIAGPQCPVKPLSKVVTSVLKRMYKRKEILIPKCIFFQRLNHFDPHKTTSLLLVNQINLTVKIKHCHKQLMIFSPSIQILNTIN